METLTVAVKVDQANGRGQSQSQNAPYHFGAGSDAKPLSTFADRARKGLTMTYCCGILVKDGLVMIADTRTNAGLDNISTFRKLHIFNQPGDRIMAVSSAGNLAISQSVLSTLSEGFEDPKTGARETLLNAPTMFQAAQRIGRAIRHVNATEGE
eukprot:gene56085-76880_t